MMQRCRETGRETIQMRLRKGRESPKEEDKEKQIIPETKRQTEVRVREEEMEETDRRKLIKLKDR